MQNNIAYFYSKRLYIANIPYMTSDKKVLCKG